ncbi:MAG TPA: dihydrolipoamide acetyltransferase family protein [Nitrospiria bacterium]|nr:dihydrolipoamide acetyltransferase family protein [Nitrospiria bacterium]
MPQMGESVVQGTIAKWLVKQGDRVKIDQPLVEVSTDKVDVEIPSPGEGVVSQIFVNEGETVDVGTELAVINGDASKREASAKEHRAKAPVAAPPQGQVNERQKPSPTREGEERKRISPLVRHLAQEHHLDLTKIKGTGLDGRITKEDVLRHLGNTPQEVIPTFPPSVSRLEEAPTEAREVPPIPKATNASGTSEYHAPRIEPKEGDQVIPFTRIRKLIAEHMVASKRISPHVTTVAEVDLTEISKLRDGKKRELKEKDGIDLTFLPFVVKAAVEAIKEFPLLNGSVVNDRIIIKKEINMGIAVETDAGLIVPVIHRADELSLLGIAKAVGDLAGKARRKQLSPQEVSGGSFTVTNPGKKGNLFGTPIIFQPQLGILRLGEVTKRPAVIEVNGQDAIAVRSMMYLSLSYDHRVIDGVTGNSFLHRVKELLEAGRFVF